VPGGNPESVQKQKRIWMDLDHISHDARYSLWPHAFSIINKSHGLAFRLASGFRYAVSTRSQMVPGSIGLVRTLGSGEASMI